MSTITRYVLVDRDDIEQDHEYEQFEFDEAKKEAQRLGYAIIAREYEYSDSELVWTPDASGVWPPKEEEKENA